jgi:hypothetical protein
MESVSVMIQNRFIWLRLSVVDAVMNLWFQSDVENVLASRSDYQPLKRFCAAWLYRDTVSVPDYSFIMWDGRHIGEQ